jgi:exopolyphosphatase / guanosine-5'-triphosphate,3'-diphosphate pyrophosphatase
VFVVPNSDAEDHLSAPPKTAHVPDAGSQESVRRSPYQSQLYGALDLGTNNCRLLIAAPAERGFRVISSYSKIVRLGEGVSQTRRLSEAAIARSLTALKVCAERIYTFQVPRVTLIATEACRAAENGADFIAQVAEETGLHLSVLDREQEAYFAALGCVNLMDPHTESALVFDIGGGSTEVVLLQKQEDLRRATDRVQQWISLPLGVVSLAEKYPQTDMDQQTYEAMVSDVDMHLAPFYAQVAPILAQKSFHLLGTSGTVTTLAAMHLGLPRYDRRRVDGLWMQDHQIAYTLQQLLTMTHEERIRHGCIGDARADLVLPGCAIFDAIRRRFPSERIRIADRGLREGILMKMMREDGVWRER